MLSQCSSELRRRPLRESRPKHRECVENVPALICCIQAHTSDLLNAFGPGDMTDYFIRFVNDLDPNGASGVYWPPYNNTARLALQFNDGSVPLNITVDDGRLAGTDALGCVFTIGSVLHSMRFKPMCDRLSVVYLTTHLCRH